MRGISEHVPGWLMVSLMFRNLREVLNCVIVHRVFLFDIPGKQELKLKYEQKGSTKTMKK